MNNQQYHPKPQQSYPYHYYPQQSPVYYPTYQARQTPQQQQAVTLDGMLPMEQSYIENILRLNRGKKVTIYMTFDQGQKTFKGIVEEAGRDHIIISEPETGKHYLLLMVYLDYVEFSEEVNYEYPLNSSSGAGALSHYPTR